MATITRRFAAAIAAALTLLLVGTLSPASATAAESDKRLKRAWKAPVTTGTFGIHSFTTQPQIEGASIRNTCAPYWRDLNPAPGVYDWSTMDNIVARHEAWGYTDIMFAFCGTPGWASGLGWIPAVEYKSRGWGDPPANMSDYRAMVTEVVKRYKGRITSYQVWNEVTAIASWQGNGKQLAEMSKILNNVVNKIDPQAQVISPSFQVHCYPDCTDRIMKPFLKEAKKRNWPFDVLAVHGYVEGLNGRYTKLKEVISSLKSYKLPKRIEIWDTETNHVGGGLNNKETKAFLSRSFLDSFRLGVPRTYWYMWTYGSGDFGDVPMNPNSPTTIKSFDTMLDWTLGTKVKSCDENGKLLVCSFKGSGKNFKMVWTSKGKATYKTASGQQACPATGGSCKTVKKGKFKATILPYRIG